MVDVIKGRRLTDKESFNMIMNEIDKALTLPNNINKILSSFINNKCVSTIPDECKEVELEIGTNSKRKATKVEHIVSADGNIR